jgi:hypothetical protein
VFVAHFLCSLTNDRPSSIYRVKPFQSQPSLDSTMMTATLGIQIIPLDQVQAVAASVKAGTGDASGAASGGALVKAGGPGAMTDVAKVAEKIVKNVSRLPNEGGQTFILSTRLKPTPLLDDTAVQLSPLV